MTLLIHAHMLCTASHHPTISCIDAAPAALYRSARVPYVVEAELAAAHLIIAAPSDEAAIGAFAEAHARSGSPVRSVAAHRETPTELETRGI